jgi:hypothetical protein
VAVTRTYVESEMARDVGDLLTLAGLSELTDGTNPDFNAPIRMALRSLGLIPADPTDVSDSDLASVAAVQLDDFLVKARYHLLLRIRTRLASLVDYRLDQLEEKMSQAYRALLSEIEAIEEELPAGAGMGGGAVAGPRSKPTNPPEAALKPRILREGGY